MMSNVTTTLLLLSCCYMFLCINSLSQIEWSSTLDDRNSYFSNRQTIKEFFEILWEKYTFLDPNSFTLCVNPNCKLLNPSPNNIYFFFETEHTIVAEGAFSSGVPQGNIPTYDMKSKYYVRIDVECYKIVDIVIDYSSLNIENIRSSSAYNDSFLQKSTYVPALPFKYDPYYGNHTEAAISTAFSRHGYGRRYDIFNEIKRMEGSNAISNMYFETLPWFMANLDSIRILLNVHQTDTHHTLEEFRVLPALLRGVVVVSEWVPLHHLLPFKDYIIFERYDKLAEKVIEVKNNYESYREKFFGPHSKLNETINSMRETAFNNLERLVLEKYNTLNV